MLITTCYLKINKHKKIIGNGTNFLSKTSLGALYMDSTYYNNNIIV